jgi:hypothetical protein
MKDVKKKKNSFSKSVFKYSTQCLEAQWLFKEVEKFKNIL